MKHHYQCFTLARQPHGLIPGVGLTSEGHCQRRDSSVQCSETATLYHRVLTLSSDVRPQHFFHSACIACEPQQQQQQPVPLSFNARQACQCIIVPFVHCMCTPEKGAFKARSTEHAFSHLVMHASETVEFMQAKHVAWECRE